MASGATRLAAPPIQRTTETAPQIAQPRHSNLGFQLDAHDLTPRQERLRRIRPQGLNTANKKATVKAVGDTIGG